jgi:hypothetical protein
VGGCLGMGGEGFRGGRRVARMMRMMMSGIEQWFFRAMNI